ncbi:hypothetical protein C479_10285 [Halovivax asiaticus JCM 14624]|uniref:Uncharacterized protein n=2 Tax=Halovivax asiaticus TaxID=332953 RepID=M0BJZ9_9EURY|nr:hypothetical protein C479_10285 [Halovivax asiaticus JCM 14624]
MRFVTGTLAWLLGTTLVLVLLDALSYELVFVCGLIGLLVVTELTAPVSVSPAWRRRLRWLIGLGLFGFAVMVAKRIVEILPPEVLPW